jgi:hypothetical protein
VDHPAPRIRATDERDGWYPTPVIPPNWQPVHRVTDGEHVGYLVPDGAPGLVLPVSLIGCALGPAHDRESAGALLRTRGLPALDRRWWCRLPAALPPGVLDVSEPDADWSWQPVVLVEVSPTGATVRPEFVVPGQTGQAALPVPVGGLLRTQPPE